MDYEADSEERTLDSLSAAEVAGLLRELRAERALAAGTPLRTLRPYMDDLEAEIEAVEYLYVLAAVTEIAGRRGAEAGRPQG